MRAKSWRLAFVSCLAIGLPNTRHWDAVFRMYHRSGLFGVYIDSDDDGFALGVGLRCHF
jgi:hypothetical protein